MGRPLFGRWQDGIFCFPALFCKSLLLPLCFSREIRGKRYWHPCLLKENTARLHPFLQNSGAKAWLLQVPSLPYKHHHYKNIIFRQALISGLSGGAIKFRRAVLRYLTAGTILYYKLGLMEIVVFRRWLCENPCPCFPWIYKKFRIPPEKFRRIVLIFKTNTHIIEKCREIDGCGIQEEINGEQRK